MSRNQKPGKFKLVGAGAQPNYGRRIGDALPGDADAGAGAGVATAAAAAGSETNVRGALLRALLFLAACAAGGVAAVYFGLIGAASA
ncbi:hypothetical protein [Novosphingobium sp. M1R2S20]|uniref:Uncharacterized protein n=1 Tax=Novosphingobium rhizovicinum TaxID=3228928 RepID=A0ABV3R8S4_9SPHN